jgi:hypothetical protein
MNREDIIRMALEAGMAEPQEVMYYNFWTADQKELERFASLVAAAEREACAKACERRGMVKGGEVFAARIRARGQA